MILATILALSFSASIEQYYGGKQAAVSFTYDDAVIDTCNTHRYQAQ